MSGTLALLLSDVLRHVLLVRYVAQTVRNHLGPIFPSLCGQLPGDDVDLCGKV